jgi:hypothetical protein
VVSAFKRTREVRLTSLRFSEGGSATSSRARAKAEAGHYVRVYENRCSCSRHRQFGADDGQAVWAHEHTPAARERGYEIHTRSQQPGHLERFDLVAAPGTGRRIFEGVLRLAVAERVALLQAGRGDNRLRRGCRLGSIGHHLQFRHRCRGTLADGDRTWQRQPSPLCARERATDWRCPKPPPCGDEPRRGDRYRCRRSGMRASGRGQARLAAAPTEFYRAPPASPP